MEIVGVLSRLPQTERYQWVSMRGGQRAQRAPLWHPFLLSIGCFQRLASSRPVLYDSPVRRKPRSAPAEPHPPTRDAGVASEADEPPARPAHSYLGRKPASTRASQAAKGSSRKTDTKPELILRRALWSAGLRYRKNPPALPGKPDVVFPGAKLALFCDGDFWHGRNWEARQEKLARGHNAEYWLAKIGRNMKRDAEVTAALREAGWTVLRVWESDVKRDVDAVVAAVRAAVAEGQRPREIG